MYKFIILMLLSFNLYAQKSITIERGVYTNHLDGGEYNEDNNMTAIELNVDKLYFNLSVFNNSYYDDSSSLGFGYKFYSIHGFNFDILTGVVTNYYDHLPTPCFGQLCVYVVPRVSYALNLTERVAFTQSVKVFGTAAIVAIGLKYEF